MNKRGIFIVLEGGEGTGKTTTSKALASKLKEQGHTVVLTREPGGIDTPMSEDIREIIMKYGDLSPKTELLLFNAARVEHVERVIKPALERGDIVICDRYTGSTEVYQGLKGVSSNDIIPANELATGFLHADYTFLFDMEVEDAFKRIHTNERETNRFDHESQDFHEEVRQKYKELGFAYGWDILDLYEGNKELSTDKIVENILSKIEFKNVA